MRILVPAVASLAFLALSYAPECNASTGRPAPRPDRTAKTEVVELHKGEMSKPTNPPPVLSPSDVTTQERVSTPPDAAEPGTLVLVLSAGAYALFQRRRSA